MNKEDSSKASTHFNTFKQEKIFKLFSTRLMNICIEGGTISMWFNKIFNYVQQFSFYWQIIILNVRPFRLNLSSYWLCHYANWTLCI